MLHSSVFPCLTIGKPSNSGCHISIFLKPTRVATLQPHGNTEIQLQGLEFRVATAIVLSFRAEKFVIGHRLGGWNHRVPIGEWWEISEILMKKKWKRKCDLKKWYFLTLVVWKWSCLVRRNDSGQMTTCIVTPEIIQLLLQPFQETRRSPSSYWGMEN